LIEPPYNAPSNVIAVGLLLIAVIVHEPLSDGKVTVEKITETKRVDVPSQG
jgi:hypothetical protein